MLRPFLLLLLSVSVLGVGLTEAARAEEARRSDRFLGSYEFAGGDAEASVLRSTLEEMVDSFNFLLRGLVRRRLERSLRVPERIEIENVEDAILLTVVGSPDFPTDAAYESDELVLRQRSFEGTRETRFQLSEDGSLLIMHVLTRSALLPDALDYELTFERYSEALVGSGVPMAEGS
jgi:hypothetical protein